jgi:hypothetical protein
MQNRLYRLEKVDFSKKQDLIDILYVAFVHKDVSPGIQTLLQGDVSKSYDFNIPTFAKPVFNKIVALVQNVLKNKINTITTKDDVAKLLDNSLISKALSLYFKYNSHNNVFNNGLYKVVLQHNNECVGMFGLFIDKVENGKIKHCNPNSFLLDLQDTHTNRLASRGLGTKVAIDYYKIMLSNKNEFANDATFEIRYVKNNNVVEGFQKKLGYFDIASKSDFNSCCYKLDGKMEDYCKLASKIVAKSQDVRSSL